MEYFYIILFVLMAGVALFLELGKSKDSAEGSLTRDFLRFRNNYVLVYALMMGKTLLLIAVVSAFSPTLCALQSLETGEKDA